MAVSRILSSPRLAPGPVRPFVSSRALRPVRSLRTATITRRSPAASAAGSGRQPGSSCSVLHRMGFFVPPDLRPGRWALTPPFHPFRPTCAGRWSVFCDTFRWPGLSPLPPARSTRHAAFRCPDFPLPACLSACEERPSAIRETLCLPRPELKHGFRALNTSKSFPETFLSPETRGCRKTPLRARTRGVRRRRQRRRGPPSAARTPSRGSPARSAFRIRGAPR